MTFLYDWFDVAAKGNFEKFLASFVGKPVNFMEIGCFEGRGTDWMLRNVLTHKDAKITVVDPFLGSDYYVTDNINTDKLEERFKENVAHSIEKVTIRKGYSQEVLRTFDPSEKFDFIYIDGSHKAADTLEDAVLAWRMLNPDGIMIFDDYKWLRFPDDLHLDPGMGIDAFLQVFEGKYELLLKEYQVVIKKL